MENYVKTNEKKIDFLKTKLQVAKKEKVKAPERRKMRNIISASKSRLKKKFENKFLYNLAGNKDDGIEQFMEIIINHLQEKPKIMEKIRQDMAKIEVPNPHSEFDDIYTKPDDPTVSLPHCLQQQPNGKFKSTADKVQDFRNTYQLKFLTPFDELHKYKQNDEKTDGPAAAVADSGNRMEDAEVADDCS